MAIVPETLTLEEEQSQELSVEFTPAQSANKAVTWTSSDATVATVDAQGRVTALRVGTAVLTATSVERKVQASCRLTVGEVELDTKNKALLVGNSFQLTPIIRPSNADNKQLTWTSSHPNIASVSPQGIVKGLAPGQATITVTTVEGKHRATCEVVVTAASDHSPRYTSLNKEVEKLKAKLQKYAEQIEKAKGNQDDLDIIYGNLNGYAKSEFDRIVFLLKNHHQEMNAEEKQKLVTELTRIKDYITELLQKCN